MNRLCTKRLRGEQLKKRSILNPSDRSGFVGREPKNVAHRSSLQQWTLLPLGVAREGCRGGASGMAAL
jgi:hypothetical protein